MPIYEYECGACGHTLEKLQKISEPVLTDCPQCGGAALQKLISAAGFRLKGGGWYETDFKSGNKKNVTGESGSKANGSGGETSGSDKPKAEAAKKPSDG